MTDEVEKAPATILWEKPNGNEIETNALKATIEYCASLGWTPIGGEDGTGGTFDDMSVAEMDAFVSENEIDVPANWLAKADGEKKMNAKQKKEWLLEWEASE